MSQFSIEFYANIWKGVTGLNEHHMFWAWVSMIWVGWSDLYIRMVSGGVLHDFNTWGP